MKGRRFRPLWQLLGALWVGGALLMIGAILTGMRLMHALFWGLAP